MNSQTHESGSSSGPVTDTNRKIIKRSRLGCLTCRQTRVKCDEVHPVCGRCREKEVTCNWRSKNDTGPRRHKNPRPFTACDACRSRRSKCGGPMSSADGFTSVCSTCDMLNTPCNWSRKRTSSIMTGDDENGSENSEIESKIQSISTSSTVQLDYCPSIPDITPRSTLLQHLLNNDTSSSHQSIPGNNRSSDLPPPNSIVRPPPNNISPLPAPAFNQRHTLPPPPPPSSQTDIDQTPTLPQTTQSRLLQLTSRNVNSPAPLPTPQSGVSSNLILSDEWPRIKELLRLYFATVHHFGYLSFIHEADFWDKYEKRHVPEELILIMAANALRFGGQHVGQEAIDQAERWAVLVGEKLLPLIFNDFGAVELMAVVLFQHYEFQSGRYSRGYTLAGTSARMMTFLRLHILDELPPPTFRPLLSVESLRRLAWSIYFLDATMDGGNFGSSNIANGALTIQLPCEDRLFLQHKRTKIETQFPGNDLSRDSQLPLAAHLIRAMSARQVLAGIHSRISRRLVQSHLIERSVHQAENEARNLLDSLPLEMAYGRSQFHVYKDQLPLLVHLHIMRNTARRHLGLLKIMVSQFLSSGDPSTASHFQESIPDLRRSLIEDTRELSSIFLDAEDHKVCLDPQLAMHAYNGIEILLFQSTRLRMQGIDPGLTRSDTIELLRPLINVVRSIAEVSELTALIHPEAVNRMVRMGLADDLTNEDFMAVLRKVHCLANVDSEFDFNESFWRYEVSMKRYQPNETGTAVSPNDILLEVRSETSPNNPLHETNSVEQNNEQDSTTAAYDRFQSLLTGNSYLPWQEHFTPIATPQIGYQPQSQLSNTIPESDTRSMPFGEVNLQQLSHNGHFNTVEQTIIDGGVNGDTSSFEYPFSVPFEDIQTMLANSNGSNEGVSDFGMSQGNGPPFVWSFLDGIT